MQGPPANAPIVGADLAKDHSSLGLGYGLSAQSAAKPGLDEDAVVRRSGSREAAFDQLLDLVKAQPLDLSGVLPKEFMGRESDSDLRRQALEIAARDTSLSTEAVVARAEAYALFLRGQCKAPGTTEDQG